MSVSEFHNPLKTLKIDFEFDHVGIAVDSIDKSSKFYKDLGLVGSAIETVEREKVRVQMFELGNNSRIELIESTSSDGPIAKFLEKRGPGLQQICLRVKDLKATLQKLKISGYRLINDEPFQGAHNCWVAFVHPSSTGGVLLELSQPMKEKK